MWHFIEVAEIKYFTYSDCFFSFLKNKYSLLFDFHNRDTTPFQKWPNSHSQSFSTEQVRKCAWPIGKSQRHLSNALFGLLWSGRRCVCSCWRRSGVLILILTREFVTVGPTVRKKYNGPLFFFPLCLPRTPLQKLLGQPAVPQQLLFGLSQNILQDLGGG